MSDRIAIPKGETGMVRLFAFAEGAPPDISTLETALGTVLDPAQVDLIALADIAEIGLSSYLITGMGVPEAALEGDAARLDALKGHVAILRSVAFERPADLTVTQPLRWIGTYSESQPDMRQSALHSEAAQRQPAAQAKPPMSDARISGMVATVVLLVLFALVAVMIWIAA